MKLTVDILLFLHLLAKAEILFHSLTCQKLMMSPAGENFWKFKNSDSLQLEGPEPPVKSLYHREAIGGRHWKISYIFTSHHHQADFTGSGAFLKLNTPSQPEAFMTIGSPQKPQDFVGGIVGGWKCFLSRNLL